MNQIKTHLDKHYLGYGFTSIAILFNVILYWLGSYDSLEQNLYDYRFKLRGPLSGDYIKVDDVTDRYYHLKGNEAIKFDYTTDNNVVIVGLDQDSYENIGRFYPYDRGIIWAKVVDNLVAAKVEVIVFDIIFDKQTKLDSIFSKSIQSAQREGVDVILAAQNKIETSIAGQDSRLIKPSASIINGRNAKLGLVGSVSDNDGFIRRYITFDNTIIDNYQQSYYSLAVQAISSFKKEEPIVTTDGIAIGDLYMPHYNNQNTFLINYIGPSSYGRAKTFNTVPLYKVLDDCDSYDHELEFCYSVLGNTSEAVGYMNDFISKEARNDPNGWINLGGSDPFTNKIAIIGSALKEQHDVFNTPFNSFHNSGEMYGIEVHANVIQQILDNNHINVYLTFQGIENNFSDRLISLFITSLIAISVFYIIIFFKPITSIGLCLLCILIWFNISIGAFINDYLWMLKSIFGFNMNVPDIGETIVLPVIYPAAAIVFSYAFNLSFKVFTEQRDKKFFKETFSQYISPELINQMFRDNKRPTLGGESGIRTAFFTDLQGFSKIAEALPAKQLVELLNEYLSEMTNILINNEGTLDKYEGDAILAIFGAPVAMDNHAEKAIDTAIKMQIKLKELNSRWFSSNKWPKVVHNMFMRIGISSGDFVVGNMGSTLRMDYTMMGDVVNVAARLESAAKIYGIGTNCDLRTLKMTNTDNKYIYRYIDKILVVGKSQPIEIVEILDFNHSDVLLDLNNLLTTFNEGMEYYKKMQWDMASKCFNKSLKFENFYSKNCNNPSRVFIERCKLFQSNPPPKDWSGIFKLESK